MQVSELSAEGLKRAFSVVVPSGEMDAARDRRLGAVARDLRLPGFRPGKVPMSLVRQRYGTAVMGEVLEERVQEATRQLLTDRGLRPALQPKVEVVNFSDGADLEVRIEMEVLPEIPMPDFAGIAVERPRAEPSEEELGRALEALLRRHAPLEEVAEERPAGAGDVVVSDFVGRLVERGEELLGEPGEDAANWRLVSNPSRHLAASLGEGGAVRLRAEPGTAEAPLRAVRADLLAKGVATGEGPVEVALRWRLVEGTLPEGTTAGLYLAAFDVEGKEVGAERSGASPPGAAVSEARASLSPPGVEGAATLRPGFRVDLKSPPAGPLVFEVASASARRGAGERLTEPFPGGSAEGVPVEIGASGFVPGFAEGLEGVRAGETRTVRVTFPEGYASAELAGRLAEFEVAARALKRRTATEADDAFAQGLGLESAEKLRDELRASLQREYDGLARLRVKRALLDQLAERASFPVPEGMVEGEFRQIWERVEADLKAGRLDDDDRGKDEATLREEYRRIAERRIRLGLLLAEIGRTNNVQVSQDELARAVQEQAARYPGQERQVLEYFQKNPGAVEGVRAPIFEEKVVDFMLELATVTETRVSPAELQAA